MMPEEIREEPKAKRAKPSLIASVAMGFIRLYQNWISPLLGKNCRFRPTCSQYTFLAIEKYGFFKGCLMGSWRIIRCNPFCKGGDDPVP